MMTIYNVLDRLRDQLVRERRLGEITIEIAWLAGLVEGEGRLKMGDRDVVERAADLLGGKLYPLDAPGPNRKAMWLTQVKGAAAAGWAMTLYPWLGARRRQQVRDAVEHWRRQGNGLVNTALADAILADRAERHSQAEIMALLKVSKSTVYRCTRTRLPRIRVIRQQQAARLAAAITTAPDMN